jgi:N-acetylglucosaminyldiphosphoundecaprenol N-acetyl-beta-D-mannosaminyltransferase
MTQKDSFSIESRITFNRAKVIQDFDNLIDARGSGYVSVVDVNVLTEVTIDSHYRSIINNSDLCLCDGGFIALIMNIKRLSRSFKTFTGPELFAHYIEKVKYHQAILGSTEKDFGSLLETLKKNGHIKHEPLPFGSVEEFDIQDIIRRLNLKNYDIVWVMLGAPKQEHISSELAKGLNNGILVGSGAALNFYLGNLNELKFTLLGLKFTWLVRLFKEPRKQGKRLIRFAFNLPKILRYF